MSEIQRNEINDREQQRQFATEKTPTANSGEPGKPSRTGAVLAKQ
jgi:hypothetical protein